MSDRLVVRGGRPLTGALRLPGCKGVSHRAAFAAAFAEGESEIGNLAPGADVTATLGVLRRLGVEVTATGPGRVRMRGRGPDGLTEASAVLDCANSGTTMRVLAGVGAGRPFLSVLTGDGSLVRRPMARVVAPLRAMGARVDGRDDGRFAPLVVRGGGLRGVRHELAVASGQVKTALVFAGLQADGVTEIVEPAASRDHTERLLRALGAPVETVDARTTRVRSGAVAPVDLEVPGDPSSAAFFAVAAAVVPGSHVVLEGVLGNPGRIAYLDVLRAMGATVRVHDRGTRAGEPVVDVEVEAGALRGTRIASHEGIVDELPVLAVAAAFAEGPTEIVDAAELRVKESDRIATLVDLLGRLGVAVEARPDGLLVGGRTAAPADGPVLESHGDHRIAMAAAVAAAALPGGAEIRGVDAVAVSYPGFAADLARLGGAVA